MSQFQNFSVSAFPNLLQIAREAGEKILAHYGKEIPINHKADDSPLTQADLAAHHHILEALTALTPDIPVVSEEGELPDPATLGPRFWVVDPLDGTKEFIQKRGSFTVNIALIENGVPVLGVVHAPALNETYHAEKGQGAFHIKGTDSPTPIHVTETPPAPAGHPPTFRPSTFDSPSTNSNPEPTVSSAEPSAPSPPPRFDSTQNNLGELGVLAVPPSEANGKEQGASSMTSREAHTKNNLSELGVLAVPPSEANGKEQGASSMTSREAHTKNNLSELGVLAVQPSSSPLRIVASRDHAGPEVKSLLARFPDASCLSIGSSLKFCLVASGQADAYLRDVPTMEWDTAAAHAILLEAGGILVEWPDLTPLPYAKPTWRNGPILATISQDLAHRLVEIPDSKKR